jgi:hypothetical protein
MASHQNKDNDRGQRITEEIIVDCYNEEEKASGWYCYMEESLKFPCQAECLSKRRGSPLRKGEKAMVVALADPDCCSKEMFVDIKFADRQVAVPLVQLKPVKATKATIEAIEDWLYWMQMGYEF